MTAVPLTIPGLRLVDHPHKDRFAIYEVPDAVAARFDCQSRLIPGAPTTGSSAQGQHYAATFRIAGTGKGTSVALLWGREDDYWKVVSWKTEPEPDETLVPPALPEAKVTRIKADLPLVHAAKNFLDTWLIRKDYDAAFHYLSTKSYACYDLVRSPDAPASTSADDAGRMIRASLERIGQWVGDVARSECDRRGGRTAPPVDSCDGSAVLAQLQPYQFPFGARRRRRVRGSSPWCSSARSAAARIRASLRYDVPSSVRRAARLQSCVCCGGRKTTPGASRRTTSSCHSAVPGTSRNLKSQGD